MPRPAKPPRFRVHYRYASHLHSACHWDSIVVEAANEDRAQDIALVQARSKHGENYCSFVAERVEVAL
jgi:hypothetical protein